MFTCLVTYDVDMNRLAAFRAYAKAWIHLVTKYGGTHHGYFMPGEENNRFPELSFNMLGCERIGASDKAIALFSFPTVEAYDAYRRDVLSDPMCQELMTEFKANPCFSGYERSFLVPVLPHA